MFAYLTIMGAGTFFMVAEVIVKNL